MNEQTPLDNALIDEIREALEAMARKTGNGERAGYARLAGEISAARARHDSAQRIAVAPLGARQMLPPEDREA